jgi:alginate O-acetyltransferase complex protein AlgI
MATGFWHGAEWTFICWGLYFAVLLTLEKTLLSKILSKTHVLKHIYVLVFVLISFVLFDSASVRDAALSVGAMFGAGDYPLISAETLYYLKSAAVLITVSVVGATPLPARLFGKIAGNKIGERVLVVVEPLALVTLLAVCTAFLIDGSFNPFLYFRF